MSVSDRARPIQERTSIDARLAGLKVGEAAWKRAVSAKGTEDLELSSTHVGTIGDRDFLRFQEGEPARLQFIPAQKARGSDVVLVNG